MTAGIKNVLVSSQANWTSYRPVTPRSPVLKPSSEPIRHARWPVQQGPAGSYSDDGSALSSRIRPLETANPAR